MLWIIIGIMWFFIIIVSLFGDYYAEDIREYKEFYEKRKKK